MVKYEPAIVGSKESPEKAELIVRHLEKTRGFKRNENSVPIPHTDFAGGKVWVVHGLMPYDAGQPTTPAPRSATGFDVIRVVEWSSHGLPSTMALRCQKCNSEWTAHEAPPGAPLGLGYFIGAIGGGLMVYCVRPGCGGEVIPSEDVPKR